MITLERLQKCNACEEGIQYFKEHYGTAVDIETLLHDDNLPKDFKYWGKENFSLTPEQEQKYNEVMRIIDSDFVYQSYDVKNSGNIVKSETIDNSAFIYYSKHINDSRVVVGSSYVEGGGSIYRSDFITNAQKIIHSKNITESSNICWSNFVIHCHDIFKSNNITNSGQIRNSENLDDCFFCSDCTTSSHLMFCHNMHGANDGYYLFNQPVSEIQWRAVLTNYIRMIEPLQYVEEWPEEFNVTPMVVAHHDFSRHYKLSSDFIEWVCSLPHYDENVLYSITMNPNFLRQHFFIEGPPSKPNLYSQALRYNKIIPLFI